MYRYLRSYVSGGGTIDWRLSRRIISKGAIFISHLLTPPSRKEKRYHHGFSSPLKRASRPRRIELKPLGWKILPGSRLYRGKYESVVKYLCPFTGRTKRQKVLNFKQEVALSEAYLEPDERREKYGASLKSVWSAAAASSSIRRVLVADPFSPICLEITLTHWPYQLPSRLRLSLPLHSMTSSLLRDRNDEINRQLFHPVISSSHLFSS